MDDPLDRIAADMRERQGRGIQWTWYDTDVVLALVEVARAARENAEKNSITYRLGDALARLERTP